MPSAHARVGASSLHRTIPCPGSVGLIESLGLVDEGSSYAREGTAAHHVRETCLMFGFEPEEFLGDVITDDGFETIVDEEMVEALRPSIEWVREREGEVVNEMRVHAGDEMPGQFGTLDVGVIAPDLIIIDDLKYGAGAAVGVEDNVQLKAYGLWFYENYAKHRTDATDFLLVIDQPRVSGGGGEWGCTLDDLLEFKEELRESFDTIFLPETRVGDDPWAWPVNPDAPLKAGEKQCQFCQAKGICPELARHNLESMSLKFDDLDDCVDVLGDIGELTLADAEEFSPKRRVAVALNAAQIKRWVDQVQSQVVNDALSSRPTPGAKLVAGRRSDKTWIDQERAAAYLRKRLDEDKRGKIFGDPKMITPTQAEALLPKDERDDLESLWVQFDGKPSLVPIDHDKPAWNQADKFED